MKPAPFEYHAAATVEDAVALLARYAPDGGRVLAGGQSFVPMMAFRLARPGHVIDINAIPALGRLAAEDGVLRIGATVRHATLERSALGGVLGRLLAEVAHSIAHWPIRTRGTFCGSIAHADPASEWCLAAATLDADIVVQSAAGTRVLPASRIFLGVMTTDIAADELVTECRIRLLEGDARFGFNEVSRRAGDYAVAAGLVTYRLQAGRIAEPRVGVGAVEHAPRRLAAAEAVLAGAAPGPDLFRAAAQAAAEAVEPMEDAQNPPAYRRQLTRVVVERALEHSLR